MWSFMRNIKIILILILLSPLIALGQLFKNLHYGVEAGIGISAGPSTFATKESIINPLSVQYYDYKRYRLPTLRTRAFVLKTISAITNIGLKTGVDIHYLERNEHGQKETSFSIPLQLIGEIKAVSINKNKALYTGIGLGYNFKNLNHFPYKERGGLLISAEISINQKSNKQNHFYYKAGFEYGEDSYCFYFIADRDFEKDEIIKMKQRRKQVYVCLGINL